MLLKDYFKYPIINDIYDEAVCPRTDNQLKLCQAIDENDIIFVSGPAGSGKSLLSIAKAIQYHQDKQKGIYKIVLSRPVIESGESLGFLPGTMEDKIHPYLIPLYDYLGMFLKRNSGRKARKTERKGGEKVLKESEFPNYIEIAPLAYLRGRTFNNSFIVLDESQNVTYMQMKLLLTRLGKNSKLILNGDTKQSDLNSRTIQGFSDAIERLTKKRSINRITHVQMTRDDILRNGLIRDVLDAYED